GLAAVALWAASATLAGACGWIAHVGTVALIRSASLVDAAPWLVLDVPPPAAWVIAAWYAGWGGLWAALEPPLHLSAVALAKVDRWRQALRRLALFTICLSAVVMARAPAAASAFHVPDAPGGWTRVVFFDVGQGD